MLFYFANTKNYTLALNDLAMPTHLFYGSSYLHVPVPTLSGLETRALSLSQSSGDTSSLVRKLGSAISELKPITLFLVPSVICPCVLNARLNFGLRYAGGCLLRRSGYEGRVGEASSETANYEKLFYHAHHPD